MDRFLTGDIWKEINKLTKQEKIKKAAIAYVTSSNLKLTKGDILICDASISAIKNGVTSAKIIYSYFKGGVKVYSKGGLHAKLLLTDSTLTVGSSNLSTNSAKSLIESSIVTYSSNLLSNAQAFFHNLIKESILLTEYDMDDLLKIKVIKRPYKPTIKSRTRRLKFGNRYWIISTHELSDRIDSREREFIEKAKNVISRSEKIKKGNINYVRWTGKNRFESLAKPGDQIIMICHDNKSIDVYPLNTILHVQREKKWTRFYYDDSRTDGKEISYSKFRTSIKNLALDTKIAKSSTKELPENDIQKLKGIWQDQ